jgi:hypothetical protein
MAITIDAPADAIWPWLCQLGQGQGGFYSYEWAENLVGLDIHNADRIVPEWQNLEVGDTVGLGRADQSSFATLKVAEFTPEESLVLRTPDYPTWWVWSFVLESIDDTATGSLTHPPAREPGGPSRLSRGSRPGFVADDLRDAPGIRSRAERLAWTGRVATGSEPSQE